MSKESDGNDDNNSNNNSNNNHDGYISNRRATQSHNNNNNNKDQSCGGIKDRISSAGSACSSNSSSGTNSSNNNSNNNNSNNNNTVLWDFAILIDLEEITYLHCHQGGKASTLVLVGQDGVQRPPILFPKGTYEEMKVAAGRQWKRFGTSTDEDENDSNEANR